MDVNSLPKTITRQRRDCDLNPGPSAPESSTLTTRIPSHLATYCTLYMYTVSGPCLPSSFDRLNVHLNGLQPDNTSRHSTNINVIDECRLFFNFMLHGEKKLKKEESFLKVKS